MSQQMPDPALPPGSPTPEFPPVQEPPPNDRDAPVDIPLDDDITPPPVPSRM